MKNGFLLIDKESDYTSRDVCNIVAKIYDAKKVGHAGTLDPFATGLLIVGLSFLKPCKLRGWGFIGCIAVAIAGIVFFVIGVTKFGDSINSYMKIKFSYGGKDYTVRSWVNEIYVKDAQNVSRQEFVNVSMSMTNSTIWWLYFPILALPTLIVGMALRAPKAKEEKVESAPAQEAKAEPQPEEEAK